MSSDEEEIIISTKKQRKPKDPNAPKRQKKQLVEKEEQKRVIKLKEFDMNSIPPHDIKNTSSGVKIVVIGKPGCFAKGTKVMKFNGEFEFIENIKVGDVLMGDDGTVRVVKGLKQEQDQMYQIKPIDGYDPYTVNQLHDLYLIHVETNEVTKISVFEYLMQPQEWQLQYKLMRSRGIRNAWEAKEIFHTYEDGFAGRNLSCVKITSFETRSQYLAGYLDANAEYIEDGEQSRYKCKEEMSDDIIWIARSLGCWARSNYVYGQVLPTRILPQLKERKSIDHLTSYFEVFPLESDTYYGFEIDGNHNFLLYNTFDAVSNTGKSSLIADIIWYKSNMVPVGMVFSGTEDSNHFYSNKFPSICVHNKLNLDMMKNFVVRQKLAIKYLKNPWAFQIIDDCTDNPTELKKPMFQAYYKNGRHWAMIHILSLQYCMDISTVIRTNVDYTFILRETNLANRERLHKNFVACVNDFQDFQTIMDTITQDYTALVVNNRVQSNNIEDCLFWYKANPSRFPEGWKFGCQDAWKFHNERYDSEYSDPVIA